VSDRGPDFFIVGAPKCATTSMAAALARHPQIFMPIKKEPHYFGSDLIWGPRRITWSEYSAYYRQAAGLARAGDASTLYLSSEYAAAEIHAYRADSRIVIMLRDPVELVQALHAQLMKTGDEDLADLGEALAAEPDRAAGRRVPARGGQRPALQYRRIATLSPQVERYLDVFGRDQVHVIVMEDVRSDPGATVAELLTFLEVDPTVDLALGRDNPNRNVRSLGLQGFIYHPPRPLSAIGRLLPLDARHRVKKVFLDANSAPSDRPPPDPAVLTELAANLRPDVERLQDLIERDLSGWARPPGSARDA
jgi:hypothetical protein